MLASWSGVRICVVRIRGERASRERWCSSKAPWRARTPIVIGSELMVVVVNQPAGASRKEEAEGRLEGRVVVRVSGRGARVDMKIGQFNLLFTINSVRQCFIWKAIRLKSRISEHNHQAP